MILSLNKKKLCFVLFLVFITFIMFSTNYAYSKDFTFIQLDEDERWDVIYEGSSYDLETDETRFTYTVIVYDNPALSHFNIGFPECDIEFEISSYSPDNAVTIGLDPTTLINGIKWDIPLKPGQSLTYSFTVKGYVAEGTTMVAIKAAKLVALGERIGPSCKSEPHSDMYSISGTAFIDADSNGIMGINEPGLPDVTVDLLDRSGNLIETTITDNSGYYIFTEQLEGHYTVVIPLSTPDIVEDFNEILDSYFIPTLPTFINVSLPDNDSNNEILYSNSIQEFPTPIDVVLSDNEINNEGNSIENNFGWKPDTKKIGEDITPEIGSGKTIGFWKHQLTAAIRGKGHAHITSEDMQYYIDEIELIYLVSPFQFDDNNEFQSAFDILKKTSSNPVDLLSKQLLGTEFNEVVGYGLSGEYAALQSALISWGEYLVAYSEQFSSAQLIEAKDIFDSINNTGN